MHIATAEIQCFRDENTSYVQISIITKDDVRRVYRVSNGGAQQLAAEINGLFEIIDEPPAPDALAKMKGERDQYKRLWKAARDQISATPKPTRPNDMARENERLREALECAIRDLDATYKAAEVGLPLAVSIGAFGRLRRMKATLSATPGNLPARMEDLGDGRWVDIGPSSPSAPSDGVLREQLARIVKGARLSSAFGNEFRAGDGRLDYVDLDAADAILALTNPAGEAVGPFTVLRHEVTAGGETKQWSEVRQDSQRPGLGRHIAHCPEHDDAVKICAALNANPAGEDGVRARALEEAARVAEAGQMLAHDGHDLTGFVGSNGTLRIIAAAIRALSAKAG